uniref:Uncharacterized protein n=1 Tax=Arundo donax TaxID=35708 RepID=A0A0A8XXP6_ARUDO
MYRVANEWRAAVADKFGTYIFNQVHITVILIIFSSRVPQSTTIKQLEKRSTCSKLE